MLLLIVEDPELNTKTHSYSLIVTSPFVWLPFIIIVFDDDGGVSVRHFLFQWLPEEIQRMEFGCRACLAIPGRARPASGYRARSQIVVCILNPFLFTFQFLCVTGSFESFVTVHVANCNTEVSNIPTK